MMFCPKCGTILMPKMIGGKRALACVKCGYKSDSESVTIKEEVKHTSKDVRVIENEQNESLPLTDNTCKKCGHKKAYFWELQTRSADEPATRFYKCEKCKTIWREYK
jgi:DNA-directed RNA polymerase subunit M